MVGVSVNGQPEMIQLPNALSLHRIDSADGMTGAYFYTHIP